MKDTFNDISRQIFYGVAKKDEENVDFILSNKKDFPYFITKPRLMAVVPIPKLVEEKFYFQGFIFDQYEKQSSGLWSLYLASIYHMGAHVAVSNFDIYKDWKQTKTQEHAIKVVDFIEDTRAESYLKENFSSAAKVIEELDTKYTTYFQNIFSDSNVGKNKFSKFFLPDENKIILSIKEKIVANINDSSNLIEYANLLYENRHLLNSVTLPYHDHVNEFLSSKIFKPIKFEPYDDFQKTCSLLNQTWINEIKKQRKILHNYKKLSKELRFDEINFAPENFSEYMRLSSETAEFVKKLKTKLKFVTNIVDSPKSDQVGILEMQKAIQAIASKNPDIEMFERDEERRKPESWSIILDSSASMEGKFHDLRKFALCLSEAADEVSSVNGQWSLSAFNNNFYVIKDSAERYGQQVKSRFGGIKNQASVALMSKEDFNERLYIL